VQVATSGCGAVAHARTGQGVNLTRFNLSCMAPRLQNFRFLAKLISEPRLPVPEHGQKPIVLFGCIDRRL